MNANTVLWFVLINNIVWMIFFLLSRPGKKTITPSSIIKNILGEGKEESEPSIKGIEELPGKASDVLAMMENGKEN